MSRKGRDSCHGNRLARGLSVMVYVMVLQVRPRPGAATRQMEKRVVTQLVVGVAAVAFLIYRQLVARRLSTSSIRIAADTTSSILIGAVRKVPNPSV